jgi:hypothetical protein
MKIIKLIGLAILIWIGYMGYGWIASAKEIEHVCGQVQAGQSKQEVIDLIQAGKNLLHFETDSDSEALNGITIYSRKCHGKVTCTVDFDGGVVVRSDFKRS